MITTLKTKIKVMYDTFNQLEDYIYLSIGQIIFDGEKYSAQLSYFVKIETPQPPLVDESGEEIPQDPIITQKIVNSGVSVFTKEQADYLFQVLHITGDTFTEMYTNLVSAGAMYEIGQADVYGLTGDDWELA